MIRPRRGVSYQNARWDLEKEEGRFILQTISIAEERSIIFSVFKLQKVLIQW